MQFIIIFTVPVICACLGYLLGRTHKFAEAHAKGVKLGRALEWQDYFFDKIEKERARHGKDGRFK